MAGFLEAAADPNFRQRKRDEQAQQQVAQFAEQSGLVAPGQGSALAQTGAAQQNLLGQLGKRAERAQSQSDADSILKKLGFAAPEGVKFKNPSEALNYVSTTSRLTDKQRQKESALQTFEHFSSILSGNRRLQAQQAANRGDSSKVDALIAEQRKENSKTDPVKILNDPASPLRIRPDDTEDTIRVRLQQSGYNITKDQAKSAISARDSAEPGLLEKLGLIDAAPDLRKPLPQEGASLVNVIEIKTGRQGSLPAEQADAAIKSGQYKLVE